MEHLKNFSDYHSVNEYNFGTYGDITRMGIKRGDTKGRRIANTAKELQFKKYTGKEVVFREEDDSSKGFTEFKIKLNPFVEINRIPYYEYEGKDPNIIELFLNKEQEPHLVVGIIGLQTGNIKIITHNDKTNKETFGEFDRKSVRIMTDMVKDFTGIDINPTKFKQF